MKAVLYTDRGNDIVRAAMGSSDSEAEEAAVVKETDPALPSSSPAKPGGDQISAVIGNVGRWQLEKVLLVFLAAAPGKNTKLLNNKPEYHHLHHIKLQIRKNKNQS